MKCEVFCVIIDRLVMNLRESAKNLVKIYPEDLNKTFIEELAQFKNILNLFSKEDKSSFKMPHKFFPFDNISKCRNSVANILLCGFIQCKWGTIIVCIKKNKKLSKVCFS